MKSYIGNKESSDNRDVYVINNGVHTLLDTGPSRQLLPLSPIYFNWGDLSSGSALLSLAILLDLIGMNPALSFYEVFKFEIVSKFPSHFCISGGEIKAWLKQTQDL